MSDSTPATPPPTEKREIPVPQFELGVNRRLLLGNGEFVEPIVRLRSFDANKFERFVQALVHGYLLKDLGYSSVYQIGGANDMGRDVIAEFPDGRWDNYQCKHYEKKLAPGDFFVELGKLVFYSFRGDFTVPRKYFIATCRGLSASLLTLLQNPAKFNSELIKHWDKYCKTKITQRNEVPLDADLKKYIEDFDFSIVENLPPEKLLEWHSYTPYHGLVFGAKHLIKRNLVLEFDENDFEAHYIKEIVDALSERDGVDYKLESSLTERIRKDINFHRQTFFSAEEIRNIALSILPDQEDFNKFKDDVYNYIYMTYTDSYKSSYDKMRACLEASKTLVPHANALVDYIETRDKFGACHHLVNEKRLTWSL